MTEQYDFVIDPTSNLHQFFAQVTAHVPSAIQEHIDGNDIANYINNFIIVTDVNDDYRSDLDDIEGMTNELTHMAARPNVDLQFNLVRLTKEFQPTWYFDCICDLTDGYQVSGSLVFNSQQMISADLLYYVDADQKEIQADQTSANWLYEAQTILLKMQH